MRTTCLLAAAVFALCAPSICAAQQAAPLTSVWLQNDDNKEEGQGFFIGGANGCFLLTAAHVLGRNGDTAASVTFRRKGGIARKAIVRWAPPPEVRYDVGVAEASEPDTPAECPSLPAAEQVEAALSTGRGELVVVDQGGERSRVPVVIVRESPQIVARPISQDDQVAQGFSGGALVMNGLVVGVVSSVDNRKSQPEVHIERLDGAPAQARNFMSRPVARGAEGPMVGLATFESALKTGTVAGRQRALTIGFTSTDPVYRATALRYAICEKSGLSISTETVPPTLAMYKYMRYMFGLVTVPISGCRVETGTFDVSAVPTGEELRGPTITSAGGQISGTRVTLRFTTGRPTLKQRVMCTGEFQLSEGQRLVGRLSCTWDDAIFSSAAVISLL